MPRTGPVYGHSCPPPCTICGCPRARATLTWQPIEGTIPLDLPRLYLCTAHTLAVTDAIIRIFRQQATAARATHAHYRHLEGGPLEPRARPARGREEGEG